MDHMKDTKLVAKLCLHRIRRDKVFFNLFFKIALFALAVSSVIFQLLQTKVVVVPLHTS